MRILKIFSIAVATVFLSVVIYANVRHLSPTEKLKAVHLASFTMKGDINSEERAALENRVSAIKGVRACTINSKATMASVTFFPDVVDEKNLVAILSGNNRLDIAKKEFATTGGCPVHAVTASVNQFVAALDIRN